MTVDWAVSFYKNGKGKEPVKEFFLSLSDEGRAKALKLLGLVKTYGVLLKEPYTRQVKDKIRELRTNDNKVKSGYYISPTQEEPLFYCTPL